MQLSILSWRELEVRKKSSLLSFLGVGCLKEYRKVSGFLILKISQRSYFSINFVISAMEDNFSWGLPPLASRCLSKIKFQSPPRIISWSKRELKFSSKQFNFFSRIICFDSIFSLYILTINFFLPSIRIEQIWILPSLSLSYLIIL